MRNYTSLNIDDLEWHWAMNSYMEFIGNVISFQIGVVFVILFYKFIFKGL
jgi:hypothetical protein